MKKFAWLTGLLALLVAGCASAPLQKGCRLCPGAPAHDLTAHLKKWGPARAGHP